MADEKKTPATAELERVPVAVDTPPAKPMDETVPGGVFIVDGVKVNAEGEPLK